MSGLPEAADEKVQSSCNFVVRIIILASIVFDGFLVLGSEVEPVYKSQSREVTRPHLTHFAVLVPLLRSPTIKQVGTPTD